MKTASAEEPIGLRKDLLRASQSSVHINPALGPTGDIAVPTILGAIRLKIESFPGHGELRMNWPNFFWTLAGCLKMHMWPFQNEVVSIKKRCSQSKEGNHEKNTVWNREKKGPDNPTCEVLCRPAWYAFGKRWVVWDEWCELVVWDEGCGIEWCEMSGVRWVVWDGLCVRWVVCEMSGVRWVVWDGWCEMSCVSCKWDEWYEMRGVRWVVWISGAGWVVWDELCEMSGVN